MSTDSQDFSIRKFDLSKLKSIQTLIGLVDEANGFALVIEDSIVFVSFEGSIRYVRKLGLTLSLRQIRIITLEADICKKNTNSAWDNLIFLFN